VQGSRYKVHDVLDQDHKDYDADTAAVWEHAEKFDPKTERMFRYLQVRALLLAMGFLARGKRVIECCRER
jgi:hypothetical protein